MVLWLSGTTGTSLCLNLADYSIYTHAQYQGRRAHMWSKNLTSAHTKYLHPHPQRPRRLFCAAEQICGRIERELLWRISGERCGRSAQECTDCALCHQRRNVYINIGSRIAFFFSSKPKQNVLCLPRLLRKRTKIALSGVREIFY